MPAGSQLLTRLLTFGLNLATARSLSPAIYGIAAVQFHLINTAILFLAREGLRRGCLRVDPSHPRATQKIVGAALLALPAGAVLSVVFTAAALATMADGSDPWFRRAVAMQGAAAFLELAAEPFYILSTVRLWFGVRVGVEAAATLAKNALTLALLLRWGVAPALAFSWGQIAYAAATVLGFGAFFAVMARRERDHHPTPAAQAEPAADGDTDANGRLELDPEVLHISGAFTLQAVGKLLLAEGSKAVLATTTPLNEQGVYGLVNNLGSLVVRTVFQPYEEIAFVAFSRPPAARAPVAAPRERAALLSSLTRGISLLGGLAAAFGPAFAHLALLLLYGARWAGSGAPAALALYSWYVALLAVNGILEAFVHAVADRGQLLRANGALGALSAVHIMVSVAAVTSAGAAGLLAADAINMALRISYCLWFAAGYFSRAGGLGALDLLPGPRTRAALVGSLAATLASQAVFMPETSQLVGLLPPGWLRMVPAAVAAAPLAVRAAAHVAVGVACLSMVAGTAYKQEPEVQRLLGRLVRRRGSPGVQTKKNL
jgi:oligosaccharide translocation protein RFT1